MGGGLTDLREAIEMELLILEQKQCIVELGLVPTRLQEKPLEM